ncbi:cytochrome b560 subunit of succinate dehydrogenase [Serendipita vermifera]|nr:cytochrome b560 subunit of succinate dehydrogenase [Serendipita vermifera]
MLAVRSVGLRTTSRLSKASLTAFRMTNREIKTESIKPEEARTILDRQRLNRPSSPHFMIYEPQITWYGSIIHRMTGVGLSVGLYGFFLSYLAAPVVGAPFDASHIIDLVHSLPEWAKYTGKTIAAAPLVYHSLNGLRHLTWDTTRLLSNAAVTRSGYAVLAGTVIGTGALVLL